MMSREDMLQELELLPVWQLRKPSPVTAEEAKSAVDKPVVLQVAASAVEKITETPEVSPQFRLLISDDAQWAFVLGAQHSDEAEALLQNMLKAVSVKVSQDIEDANTEQLNKYVPKGIVVMGEAEAQQLLNEKQTLEQLRAKAHQYQNIPVVATYAPSHLLLHLQDKAKTWDDLCLAKLTIASL
ncbi:MAG: hypothetical protein ACKE5M_04350 [Methylophilaceae bacterium]